MQYIEIFQSLIQKAVRRGDTDMVYRATQFLFETGNKEWLRRRLPVLIFEECWTLGNQYIQVDSELELTKQLIHLARSVKNKNACGLGSLAYQLSLGDETAILATALEKDLRFVAEAIKNPLPFWKWMKNKIESHNELILNAQNGFEQADRPWDKAFMLAAIYLAVTDKTPETKISNQVPGEFPLWIAIDRHTAVGIEKITEAANQINIKPEQALWLSFYFEGALCNAMMPSPWWEQEKIWRMKRLGLSVEEGGKQYEKLKPVLVKQLKEEEKKLRELIFSEPSP